MLSPPCLLSPLPITRRQDRTRFTSTGFEARKHNRAIIAADVRRFGHVSIRTEFSVHTTNKDGWLLARSCRRIYSRITKFGLLVQRDVRRRKWRTTRHELVYFCSEHIENAEASRARVCLLVHDINSELHPLAVDVHSFDRSAFRDAIKVVRECSSCVISARQLHMPRRFDGHRLPPGADAYRRLNRRECRTAIARCGNVPFGTPYQTDEQKRRAGQIRTRPSPAGITRAALQRGHRKKIAMNWHPSLTKRSIFCGASAPSMGELNHTAELKGQVARFLHQHKDDGRESA